MDIRTKQWLVPGGLSVSTEGNFDLAIKTWKYKLKESGRLHEVRRKSFYLKPSVTTRQQKKKAQYREKNREKN